MVERSIFAFYAWNSGPVDGTGIYFPLADINIELPFTIYPSPKSSREVTSEGQKALDHFEASSQPLFRQIELFNILVY